MSIDSTKATLLLLCFLSAGFLAQGQGEYRSFGFLHLPANATLTGMGGVNVSSGHEEVSTFLANPALATDSLSGEASVSFLAYFASVGYTTVAYAQDLPRLGLISVGIQHLALGEIQGRDASGHVIGDVRSGETALTMGRAYHWGPFGIGANLKWVLSNIAGYRAGALMLDAGGAFVHPDRDLSVGLAFKNLGFLLSDYSSTSDTKLPWDIQLGASFKPRHMPFRFSITAHRLYKGNLLSDEVDSGTDAEKNGAGSQVLSHFVFGGELLIGRHLRLRSGYNALIRKELSLENTSGGAGFSYGVAFQAKSFGFTYSRGGYHAAGGAHHFSIRSDLKALIRKK